MFERFTDRARRVLVLAQEEARLLNHGFIGTEHILLGLIHEGDGVGAQALERLGITLEGVRAGVEEIIGLSASPGDGSPPFTPRANKVLELSLREALQLGHDYIGTEHILLGLVREGHGVAAQVLVGLGLDLARVRQQVIQLLSGYRGRESEGIPDEGPLVSRHGALVECSFCGRRPPQSGQLVSGRGSAYVCEHCISELGARLAAGGEDDSGVTAPPVVITGRLPDDEEAARTAITSAFARAFVLSEDRRTVPTVEGGELLGPCLKEAQVRHAALRRRGDTVAVDRIEFIDEEHASVSFTISLEGVSSETRHGDALVVDSAWKVARATFCALMGLAGVECPPTR
ncbi:MAG TPA: Clp protease N-terminal domain-containing protein [Acidimicrobiales bacterium]|nr:Clp protease N-terminal domain-containing protein [Acidimicrobiales bacterium]